MRRISIRVLSLMIALGGFLMMGATARAASYGVDDGANFFSKDAIDKANDLIDQIRAADNREVLVVTFDTIPPGTDEEMRTKGKAQFFNDWAQVVAKERKVNGIIILMTKTPGHLEIAVGNKTQKNSFTLDDRDQLNTLMLEPLRAKQFDDALIKGLEFIKDHMRRATEAAGADSWAGSTSVPFHFPVMGWLCAGIAILGIVFFIMNIVNRGRNYGGGYGGGYNAPPPGGYPPGYAGGGPQGGGYYGGGGGGFGRGLLGGLLGGALGAWGYDRFFQGGNNPTSNPPPPPAGAGGDFGASNNDQTDTSFSGTGGDFGSSGSSNSSGGDFGSSADSSNAGSDFGSGDSGGGGSDFGSSGGDFGGGGGDF